MARSWFGKSTSAQMIDPYYEKPSGWKVWVRRVIGVVVLLGLIYLFIWAAMWVYQSVTDDGTGSQDSSSINDTPQKDDDAASGNNGNNGNGTGGSAGGTAGGGSNTPKPDTTNPSTGGTGSGGSNSSNSSGAAGGSGGSSGSASAGAAGGNAANTAPNNATGSNRGTSDLPHTGDDPTPNDQSPTTPVLPATGG